MNVIGVIIDKIPTLASECIFSRLDWYEDVIGYTCTLTGRCCFLASCGCCPKLIKGSFNFNESEG